MNTCIKCNKAIPEDSLYCNYCGKKQEIPTRTKRTHGNGLGTVYKYKGKWKAEYTTGYEMIDGKIKRRKITKQGFATKKDATLYLQSINGIKQSNNISLKKLWLDCKDNVYKDMSKDRIHVYELNFDRLFNFHNKKITDISFHQLQSHLNKYTHYQAKDIKLVLNTIYKHALLNGYIQNNLIPNLKLPKDYAKRDTDAFQEHEIAKVWQEYNKSKDKKLAGILIMIYTGLMPIELCSLCPNMIDFQNHTINGCNSVKTTIRETSTVVFPSVLTPLLEHLCDTHAPDKLLFPHSTQSYSSIFKRIILKLELNPALTPYSCRRTTGTALALANVPPAIIAEILRHAKYETTMKYYTVIKTNQLIDHINKLEIPN